MKMFFVAYVDPGDDTNLDLFVTADTPETAIAIWKLWVTNAMEYQLTHSNVVPNVLAVPSPGPHPMYHAWHGAEHDPHAIRWSTPCPAS